MVYRIMDLANTRNPTTRVTGGHVSRIPLNPKLQSVLYRWMGGWISGLVISTTRILPPRSAATRRYLFGLLVVELLMEVAMKQWMIPFIPFVGSVPVLKWWRQGCGVMASLVYVIGGVVSWWCYPLQDQASSRSISLDDWHDWQHRQEQVLQQLEDRLQNMNEFTKQAHTMPYYPTMTDGQPTTVTTREQDPANAPLIVSIPSSKVVQGSVPTQHESYSRYSSPHWALPHHPSPSQHAPSFPYYHHPFQNMRVPWSVPAKESDRQSTVTGGMTPSYMSHYDVATSNDAVMNESTIPADPMIVYPSPLWIHVMLPTT